MFFGKKSGSQPPQPEPASPAPAAAKASEAERKIPAGANGTSALAPEEAKKRATASKQIAATFGEIVTLLMRAPGENQHALRDLDWMVVPAITQGQFALAEAQSKETGAIMPVGCVLWAFVSSEIDQRLSDPATNPVRLTPSEWRSGDIPWIILSCGDPKVMGGLLEQLAKTVFKDRPPKIRGKNAEGKIVVGRLEIAPKPPATA